MKHPTESYADPFRLARQLRARFPYHFTPTGWDAHPEVVRASLAGQLKAAFDKDRLLGEDGRVLRVTSDLVDSVALALASLMVSE